MVDQQQLIGDWKAKNKKQTFDCTDLYRQISYEDAVSSAESRFEKAMDLRSRVEAIQELQRNHNARSFFSKLFNFRRSGREVAAINRMTEALVKEMGYSAAEVYEEMQVESTPEEAVRNGYLIFGQGNSAPRNTMKTYKTAFGTLDKLMQEARKNALHGTIILDGDEIKSKEDFRKEDLRSFRILDGDEVKTSGEFVKGKEDLTSSRIFVGGEAKTSEDLAYDAEMGALEEKLYGEEMAELNEPEYQLNDSDFQTKEPLFVREADDSAAQEKSASSAEKEATAPVKQSV